MRLFGLIGYPLGHSFSKKYFTEKFEREGISGCRYELFPLQSITELPDLLQARPELLGLNITIPYKQEVLQYVTHQNPVVAAIGAANCVRVSRGVLSAYNTDVTGFERSLTDGWKRDHQRALILGTGGASKAVEYVLSKMGLELSFVSRQASSKAISYEELSPELIRTHTLVVNTTPLGTFPQVEEAPRLTYEAVTPEHYFFDLVYNPAKTKFLQLAEERGAEIRNGSDMLAIQAEESWKIWNSD